MKETIDGQKTLRNCNVHSLEQMKENKLNLNSKTKPNALIYGKNNNDSRTEKRKFYIASCVFTSKYPALSFKIQKYIQERFHISIVRCCTPKYKLKKFEDLMPNEYRDNWCFLRDSEDFRDGDTVYSICHNCLALIEETQPQVTIKSIWELLLEDKDFAYPNYHHMVVTVQDCWRSYDRLNEQMAIREILKRMNIEVVESPDNYEKANFCGTTLYAPCIPRNAKMAPRRFVENAVGKFKAYSEEEQKEFMDEYVKKFTADKVVTYCHYCQSGLEIGGMKSNHLAELLFDMDEK